VVDDQIDGDSRLHRPRVTAQRDHGISHRGKVHDGRDAGEVLHQDTCRHELQLAMARFRGRSRAVGQRSDVVRGDVESVLVPQQVLEEDAERIRQPARVVEHRIQAKYLVLAVSDGEPRLGAEAVCRHPGNLPLTPNRAETIDIRYARVS
jgi:hypothetical protein